MKQIFVLKEPAGEIKQARDLFEKIQSISIDHAQENFIVVYLNTKNQIIDAQVLFKGGINATSIDPRTLFRNALLRNSFSIIVAHNHPSGNLEPSDEDVRITHALKQAGDVIGLKILDHIIFNEKEFYSLDSEGDLLF